MSAVYNQLAKACLPMIQSHRDDLLVHDKLSIEDNECVPFLHWTRPLGTSITFMPPIDHPSWPKYGEHVKYLFGTADREHILSQIVGAAKYHADNPQKYMCHHYDGKILRSTSCERAVLIANEYARPIRNVWHTEWIKNTRPLEYAAMRDSGRCYDLVFN